MVKSVCVCNETDLEIIKRKINYNSLKLTKNKGKTFHRLINF